MPDQKLKEPLSRLKKALQEIEPADVRTRDLLNQLIIHLEAQSNAAPQTEEHRQLLTMLKDKAVYFESAHPVVGSTIGEIVGILTRMGI